MGKTCLIGYSGFVGETLLRQTAFDDLYRSINISDIDGREYDLCVCAAAPAKKWIANKEPESDLENIKNLISQLKTIKCEKFILVSTVDVFKNPENVNEDTQVVEDGLHPYGLHRRILEKFIEGHFPNYLIVRLPGLVGPGLKKNIIFDFLNSNNLSSVESRSVFQFYPMINLWYDIQVAIDKDLKLVHLTSEPISVASISKEGFGKHFKNEITSKPIKYDMQSLYSGVFGGNGAYQYSIRETIQAVRAYAQSEPITLKLKDT
jgi:hypothetical protein